MKKRTDLYKMITDKIIAELETGTVPWEQPWFSTAHHNPVTGTVYSGINVMLLSIAQHNNGFSAPIWTTFKGAKSVDCSVIKGSRCSHVVFSKPVIIKGKETDFYLDQDGNPVTGKKRIFMLRSTPVFNIDQLSGSDENLAKLRKKTERPTTTVIERFEMVESMVEASGAVVKDGGNRAYYTTNGDYIGMPALETFKDAEAHASTLLHELTHWTGHKSRLDRDLSGEFGSEDYAFEELGAEQGAAFLMGSLGLKYRTQHASYIESWLKALKNDKRYIVRAAAKANKATEYLWSLYDAAMDSAEMAEEVAAHLAA